MVVSDAPPVVLITQHLAVGSELIICGTTVSHDKLMIGKALVCQATKTQYAFCIGWWVAVVGTVGLSPAGHTFVVLVCHSSNQ
ncbi:hypothetical protein BJX66DRAFT_318786 [Aspergillus keveii]|uniref:Uncharacterized protein n=1 Tax=Aspergillus keveii TaxID=714993 RepID=A0ABR4FJ80_9EURO